MKQEEYQLYIYKCFNLIVKWLMLIPRLSVILLYLPTTSSISVLLPLCYCWDDGDPFHISSCCKSVLGYLQLSFLLTDD